MGLTQDKVNQIKSVAGDKNVIVLIADGHTLTGVLKEVTPEHIKLESAEDITYLTVDSIKALRIWK